MTISSKGSSGRGSKVTGDADVQTQKVAGTNEVIIKTKNSVTWRRDRQLDDATG